MNTYIRDVARTSLLTLEQERALAARIAQGDQAALNDLVAANLRLVIKIARTYRLDGMTLDDLIQEGNLGLLHAARKFDPETHGTRFSTYASLWIRGCIGNTIRSRGPLVRIPYHVLALRAQFKRASEALGTQDVERIANHLDFKGVRRKRLRRVIAEPLDLDNDIELKAIPSRSPSPGSYLEASDEERRLKVAMASLFPLEAWVIGKRHGLIESTPKAKPRTRRGRPANSQSHASLALERGMTAHQIRMAEASGMAKLRRAFSLPFA
jgi:RNA polymerase sigma factor (sigma-70 family)